MNLQKQQEETRLRAQWKERDRKLWERIDTVIKIEDERVRMKQEAERRKREEEEKAKREAEEKKRKEEERKRMEEEAKRNAEEEKRKMRALEEEEKRRQTEAQRERETMEGQGRSALGYTTSFEDWERARETLKVRSPVKVSLDLFLSRLLHSSAPHEDEDHVPLAQCSSRHQCCKCLSLKTPLKFLSGLLYPLLAAMLSVTVRSRSCRHIYGGFGLTSRFGRALARPKRNLPRPIYHPLRVCCVER